jgi:hypothetical protein
MNLRALRSAFFSCFCAPAGETLQTSTPTVKASNPESFTDGATKPRTYKSTASTATARCGKIQSFFQAVRSFFTCEAPASRLRTHGKSATAGMPPAGTGPEATAQSPQPIRVDAPPNETGSEKPAALSTVDIDREENLVGLLNSNQDFSHAAFTGRVVNTLDLWALHQIVKRYESQAAKPDMKGLQLGFNYINPNKHNKVECAWNLAPCQSERETRENLEAIKALMDLGSKPAGKPLILFGDISAKPQDSSGSTQTDDAAPPSTLGLLLVLKNSHSGLISLEDVQITASLSDAIQDPALMEQLKQARKLGAQVALEAHNGTMTLGTMKAVKQLVDAGVNTAALSFTNASFKKDELEEARRLRSKIDDTKVDMQAVDARLKRSRS